MSSVLIALPAFRSALVPLLRGKKWLRLRVSLIYYKTSLPLFLDAVSRLKRLKLSPNNDIHNVLLGSVLHAYNFIEGLNHELSSVRASYLVDQ